MDSRERRQLRKLAREMSDTGDMEQFVLASGCLELLDYLDVLLRREEIPLRAHTNDAPKPQASTPGEQETSRSPEPDLEPVTCWCRGEQLWQRR